MEILAIQLGGSSPLVSKDGLQGMTTSTTSRITVEASKPNKCMNFDPVSDVDAKVATALSNETKRQQDTLMMIASENPV